MLHRTRKNETFHRMRVREAVMGRKKILVVEDHGGYRRIVVYRLRNIGDF